MINNLKVLIQDYVDSITATLEDNDELVYGEDARAFIIEHFAQQVEDEDEDMEDESEYSSESSEIMRAQEMETLAAEVNGISEEIASPYYSPQSPDYPSTDDEMDDIPVIDLTEDTQDFIYID
jgi:hypothetical protein